MPPALQPSAPALPSTDPWRRQDKKLKEGFARLQQENEALRQQLAQLAGRGVPVSLPPAMGGLGGGGGGRASRIGVLGMEADGGLGGGVRPGTAIGVRCEGRGQGRGTADSRSEQLCRQLEHGPDRMLSWFTPPCRNPPPDPSHLSSVRLGPGADFGAPANGGGGGFGYDTPANQPAALRQMHSGGRSGLGGGGGLGGSARVGRNMSGGMGSGGMGAGGMASGGLLAAQLAMGGGGMGSHQALQNDRRQAMGLPGAPAFRCARECGVWEGGMGAWMGAWHWSAFHGPKLLPEHENTTPAHPAAGTSL